MVRFASTVLWTRGSRLQEQPLQDENSGSVLLWNGDVFGGLDIPSLQSDSSALLNALDGIK
jgi:hypothetical protein